VGEKIDLKITVDIDSNAILEFGIESNSIL